MNPHRYRPIPCTALADRTWPERSIDRAPIWCSVDLRDGNQALVEPMDPGRKLMFFRTLVETGLKEIEVGFPAASQTDYDFLRLLIEGGHIPDDVTIQVLTQAREPLIRRTVEAVRGARRVILHLYNSTSTLQRRVVFAMTRDEIRDLAVQGARWMRSAAATLEGSEVRFEYSPESFTGTELDFAAEVVDAVVAEWGPGEGEKVIVNLPSTVELTTPNRYADQIEWMHRNLALRDRILLSVHTHNDRGCAVAATELALLAGAERVEGTLFGNGERTGNVDLVTVALNMYSQGVDPGLDLSDLPALVETFEHCNRLPVPARHPYAGQLVFTAFSGSHQDAIKKGLEALEREHNPYWEVPYLPVDPSDLGREQENFIRINSQSGKGGVAFVMENSFGYVLPRGLAIEFSGIVQRITDDSGAELAPDALLQAFTNTYLEPGRLELAGFETERRGKDACTVRAIIVDQGQEREVTGTGNGPIDAFVRGLRQALGLDFRFQDYFEHALGDGADARALAYVQLRDGSGASVFGVGQDPDIVAASLQAVLHGAARMLGEMAEEAAS